MARRKGSRLMPLNPVCNPSDTPMPTECHSVYSSENDSEVEPTQKLSTFPFLSLPLELRNRVYGFVFSRALPEVLDLDPETFEVFRTKKVLAMFFVSRKVHLEATRFLFSTYTFRMFPIHPGRYFRTKRPLLARLPASHRTLLTIVELRLGPGWADPPRGWVVNEALGLGDCTQVRTLKLLVECDPSDAIFKGYRRSEGFYEQFCQRLLKGILDAIPSIQVVQFDAWSSVKRDGAMIRTLEAVVKEYGKIIGGLK